MSKSRTKKSIAASKKQTVAQPNSEATKETASASSISFLPVKVTDVDLVFPGDVSKLMPPLGGPSPSEKALDLRRDWMYHGLKELRGKTKEGVDFKDAIRHIKCILCSFQPSHEDKEEAIARLIDMWFEDYSWDKADGNKTKETGT